MHYWLYYTCPLFSVLCAGYNVYFMTTLPMLLCASYMCLSSALLQLALQEKNKEYSEKQKAGGAPTKSMLKLAWDLQELSALNCAGREVRVAYEVLADKVKDPAYDPVENNLVREITVLWEKLTSFVQRVSRYQQTPLPAIFLQ